MTGECPPFKNRMPFIGKKRKADKGMKLKKFAFGAITIVTLVGMMMFLTGCDPEKIGGGGLMQSYNPLNGQYR